MIEIHIGQLIRQKQEEKGITISELARSIHCDRSNIYNIFSRKSIDIELLISISKALDFDFISNYYLPKIKQDNKELSITITVKKEGDKLIISECK
ncbi:MAG: hypothetical protein H6Q16_929 [Bacteroidetes bacterium]|nr:hypothetical protein [Bacteroidota bacterium]